MNLSPNKYFGTITKSLITESFNVSLTNHSADLQISLHAHEKPYLCLLASGNYHEKSNTSEIISQGEVVFRQANYEHSNSFSNEGGLCMNLEINDHEHFMACNEIKLPNKALKQKASTEVFKLLYAFKKGLPNDIIDIVCYESIIAVVNVFNAEGDVLWVKKMKEMINDNPAASISLDALSRDFSLHPNYIVRKFKNVTGFKLSEYLTRVRLEHSINQLLSSEDKMVSIAIENGFYDQSHFNRNFKNHFETTPKKFKKTVGS